MPDDPLPHLRFNAPAERLNFSGQGRGNTKAPFARDRAGHATILRSQFSIIDSEFGKVAADRQLNQISSEFGLILNVVSEPDYPLAFTSLENVGRGSTPSIVLLHLRREDTPQGKVTKAAVFVPYGQLKVLVKKVEDYATKNRKDRSGNITAPRNEALLANISSISVAAFEALWTDPEQPPTADALAWFELWIRRDDERWEAQLRQKFAAHNLEFPDLKLVLPEHVVIVVQATRETIESLPEIASRRPRVFCMAITARGPNTQGRKPKIPLRELSSPLPAEAPGHEPGRVSLPTRRGWGVFPGYFPGLGLGGRRHSPWKGRIACAGCLERLRRPVGRNGSPFPKWIHWPMKFSIACSFILHNSSFILSARAHLHRDPVPHRPSLRGILQGA